jgi:pimeloyl-ACP methyl ester carboxylesterase
MTRRAVRRWLPALASCAIVVPFAALSQATPYQYRQAGSGAPVVVFESGLGMTRETWRDVQDEVSLFTETFSYNRAGYARSPKALGTRDAATVVAELRALLAERGLAPPYLLVGHSLGGLYMQYYARNFPNEVTGLVLVDSSHWEQSERLRAVAPSVAADAARRARSLSGIVAQENAAFELSERQVRDSPPLRPMPLIVLSAGQQPRGGGVPAEFWAGLQRELAAQLPGARHTIAERSGHFIQERQPQYVWAAVRDIVIALRGR